MTEKGPMEERALIARAKTGDREAFGSLVLLHQDAVYRLVRGILGNEAESEDVGQEIFLKAFQALPRFRGDSAFYTWIYRIAVNEALKVRRKRRFTTEDLPEAAAPEPEAREGPTMSHLEQLLQEIPEEFRTVLVLREIEGLSYQDIAETLEIPIGTVESRIFRARQEMRARWRKIKEEEHVV